MSQTDQQPQGEPSGKSPEEQGHEHLDVNSARIVRWALGLVVGTVVAVLVLAFGYASLEGIAFGDVFTPEEEQLEAPLPPQPRLERDPYANRQEIESRERERLEAWSWIDREADVARIPIDRAMGLVVEHYEQQDEPFWGDGEGSTEPPPPGPRGEDPTGDSESEEESPEDDESVDTEAPPPSGSGDDGTEETSD